MNAERIDMKKEDRIFISTFVIDAVVIMTSISILDEDGNTIYQILKIAT